MAKCSHPALPPALWQIHTAGPYGGCVRPIQALTRAGPPLRMPKHCLEGGLLAGGEVWFGSFFKGIPPILTILHCFQKLHDIWVMLLI